MRWVDTGCHLGATVQGLGTVFLMQGQINSLGSCEQEAL